MIRKDTMENAKTYGYIYKITVKETGQYYIGQHKAYRPGEVEKTYWGSGKIIYNIKRKHKDFENYLEREILEWAGDPDELNYLEAKYVTEEVLKDPKNINLMTGGGARGYGWHLSEEQKEIVRDSNRKRAGWHHTEESKRRISESLRARAKKKRPMDFHTKIKISRSLKMHHASKRFE